MKFIKSKSQWKIYENLTQARKVLKDNNQTESNKEYNYIKSELKNHLGYLGWFTKMMFTSEDLKKSRMAKIHPKILQRNC